MAATPKQFIAAMALTSARVPAPPEGSNPAIVITTGGRLSVALVVALVVALYGRFVAASFYLSDEAAQVRGINNHRNRDDTGCACVELISEIFRHDAAEGDDR